ncbi:hypothetical protein A2130_04265 [Candidatus Woesebacteria bacterium GWC2_33_12]|uniref:HicB-like antitoxin of toxin-antitoxin system domain-containing protein n=1 Tax=Candidatus Woesebacteria bacterium GW2011_GWB1_33_22 TaxID=1618566 RepID=A0A0F9ZJM4_9BACT|nr:MAG: hypothetical protein UR29_C0015G0005 [Candidatus Woesebacteria bacterium GW2011_GWC2_33_12]KKP41842.1 MAG: hypothetical protein UR33_C0009G0036 [Candidatus Woesebacteria bacterium GW2011_GWA2_33_20]KKP44299.1 MAG: hypothetical protein UR35_C0009G0010 [Candidatus Woesebacteria bacterium GW2011_GWB1_33_22]KKP46057.1 MAG: hypothetical protein UR37_C0012G0009 [Microgenomates group bacterium GW2011_GWC1_33_28]KKP49946.1 MAG: hypothetical protein UR41_C0011G0008 [Candidatus Woesebacteria bact
MKINLLKYNVFIKKEGKFYVAQVPTLGISDFGKTIEETQKNVKQAIECHIEGLLKTKTEIPEPDTQDYFISQTEVNIPQGVQFAF